MAITTEKLTTIKSEALDELSAAGKELSGFINNMIPKDEHGKPKITLAEIGALTIGAITAVVLTEKKYREEHPELANAPLREVAQHMKDHPDEAMKAAVDVLPAPVRRGVNAVGGLVNHFRDEHVPDFTIPTRMEGIPEDTQLPTPKALAMPPRTGPIRPLTLPGEPPSFQQPPADFSPTSYPPNMYADMSAGSTNLPQTKNTLPWYHIHRHIARGHRALYDRFEPVRTRNDARIDRLRTFLSTPSQDHDPLIMETWFQRRKQTPN